MIQLLLMRHAPTAWNADRRIQGRSDIPLSPEGLAAAADWRLPEDAVLWTCASSPLLRARQTAEAMGRSPVAHPALIEMDWGRFEGRRLAELREDWGAALAAEEAKGLDFRPPGGETPREVGQRALAGLAALTRDSIVVTHKGVLRPLFAIATGWDMRAEPLVKIRDNCCHRFALDGGVLRLVEPNIPLRRCDSNLAAGPDTLALPGKPARPGGPGEPDRPARPDKPKPSAASPSRPDKEDLP
jgi:probable phosphoglycerate mutase